jgi:predicted nucleotidyltransferase
MHLLILRLSSLRSSSAEYMTTLAHAPHTTTAESARIEVSAEDIRYITAQIADLFRPLKIILFGSWAYGEPRPESDLDLLVVMETPLKETEQAVEICQAIDYHIGLDLLVRTPVTLAKRLALGDPFLREVVQQGKVVYERTDG